MIANTFLGKMLEGRLLDEKYLLRQQIGEGGYGAVFVAQELVAGTPIREVVVKLLPLTEDDRSRQMREIQVSTTLQHPHLIRCFTSGHVQCNIQGKQLSLLYLVMERAEESLKQRLKRGVLTPAESEVLLRQMSAALEYLHDAPRNLAHRDLKPDNILWCGGVWKLADFGMARMVEGGANRSTATAVLGTPGYTPPEIFKGNVNTSGDIWSLGVVLAEAMTGQLPFPGKNMQEQISAIMQRPPVGLEFIPEPFRLIAQNCLLKNPEHRLTPLQITAMLDNPPREKPSQDNIVRGVASAVLTGGLLVALREALGLLMPGSETLLRPADVLNQNTRWLEQVHLAPLSSFAPNAMLWYMIFGIISIAAVCWLGLRKLNGSAVQGMAALSLYMIGLVLLIVLGGCSAFYLIFPASRQLNASPDSILLMQSLLQRGIGYAAYLPAMFWLSLLTVLDAPAILFSHLAPAYVWLWRATEGLLLGGLFAPYSLNLLTDRLKKYLQTARSWGTGALFALSLLLAFFPLSAASVYAGPGSLGPHDIMLIQLKGRWEGVLQGQNANVYLAGGAGGFLRGSLAGAGVTVRTQGSEVMMHVRPYGKNSPWQPEYVVGAALEKGDLITGTTYQINGRADTWYLRRVQAEAPVTRHQNIKTGKKLLSHRAKL